jgi:hypothetical protein
MSENPIYSAIRALDEFDRIYQLQQLLHICINELDSVPAQVDSVSSKSVTRIDLLISIYLSEIEPHFEELKFNLETIIKSKTNDGL